MHPDAEHLRQLPITEKLQVVEEAQRRADELEADPSIALTREELWRRVGESDS